MATKVTGWQWTGIATAAIVAVGLIFGISRSPDESSERTSTTPQAQINLTTAGETPLIFQISTATVDICYTGSASSGREKNLLLEPFLSEQRALGFNRAMIFADGSVMQCSHIAMPPAIGHGYNGNPKDFPTIQEYNEAMGGALARNWSGDFFTNTVAFIRAVGIPMDVTLNKRDTWKQNKYRIDSTKAEYIKLWSEVKILKDTNGEWQNYLKWAIATTDSIKKYYGLWSITTPNGKKVIADEPNIYQKDKKSMVWRANINPTSLTGIYGADNYWQTGDQNNYTANQDSNIIRVRHYFDTLMPQQMAQFKSLFPNWKMFAGQVQIEDRRDEKPIYVTNTIVGSYAWGRMYQSFIENQDFQPIGVQQSMKNCSDPTTNATKILTLLNTILKPDRKVVQIAFTGMEGVTGAAVHNAKSYTVLLNNYSRNTYSLPNIWIDGKKKVPTFTTTSHTSADWYSPVVIETSTADDYTVPPGVTILTFTLGNSTAESRIK